MYPVGQRKFYDKCFLVGWVFDDGDLTSVRRNSANENNNL